MKKVKVDDNLINAKEAIKSLERAIDLQDKLAILNVYEYSDFHINWEAISDAIFNKWDSLVSEANDIVNE